MSELCAHGRIAGSQVCTECPSGTAEAYVDPYDEPIGSCTEISPTGEEEMKDIVYDGDREFREHTIIGKGPQVTISTADDSGFSASYYRIPHHRVA